MRVEGRFALFAVEIGLYCQGLSSFLRGDLSGHIQWGIFIIAIMHLIVYLDIFGLCFDRWSRTSRQALAKGEIVVRYTQRQKTCQCTLTIWKTPKNIVLILSILEVDTLIATAEDEEHNHSLDRNLEPTAHVSDPSALWATIERTSETYSYLFDTKNDDHDQVNYQN
jgi:hypothetical protein